MRPLTRENVEVLSKALGSAPADPEAVFAILDEKVEWDYVGAFPESIHCSGYATKAEAFEAAGL